VTSAYHGEIERDKRCSSRKESEIGKGSFENSIIRHDRSTIIEKGFDQ